MTQEFLERTDAAGNMIYTSKTGENVQNIPKETKMKDNVEITVSLDGVEIKHKLEEILSKGYVEQIIEDYDMSDCVETLIGDYDYSTIVEEIIENTVDSFYINDRLDRVKESILDDMDIPTTDTVLDIVKEALDSFNVDQPCDIGIVFREAVLDVIKWHADTNVVKIDDSVAQRLYTQNEIINALTACGFQVIANQVIEQLKKS